MTLFQYDDDSKFYQDGSTVDTLIKVFAETGAEFGDAVFLGSKRNKEVIILYSTPHKIYVINLVSQYTCISGEN